MDAGSLIASILRHDKKTASYKIALIRSINDVALGFPHISAQSTSIAVPLRFLAQFWIAYYWPFVDAANPIQQGRHPANKQDISIRPALARLCSEWEAGLGASRPSDGFFLSAEFQSEHRRNTYPASLRAAYARAIADIIDAIQQPIRYAGPDQYSVFGKPACWRTLQSGANMACLPKTAPEDLCIVLSSDLWSSFCSLSLWIEALCIHEWSLFTESIAGLDRGIVYSLLTDRPDNRRPLTWERNNIDILMMEGELFQCPWTGKKLAASSYDLDHLLPVSIYPINELWNIVPADRDFNQHRKRNLLPGRERLADAQPRLASIYRSYEKSDALASVLRQDSESRFDGDITQQRFSLDLAGAVVHFLETVAISRNIAFF